MRIVQFSDIHVGSPYSFRYQPAWRENFDQAFRQVQKMDPQPEAIVISGDLTRDGETHLFELREVKAMAESYGYPVFFIPGNHDVGGKMHKELHESVSSEKISRYKGIFGDDKFDTTINDLRLVGFNSFLLGSGLPEEEEIWTWIEQKAKERSAIWKNQIWFLHTPAFHSEPFEILDPVYEKEPTLWYCVLPNKSQHRLMKILLDNEIKVVACGHIHEFVDRTVSGIRQIICPSTAFGAKDDVLGFLQYDISDEIHVEMIRLEKNAEMESYGEGGHFKMKDRDYSKAWKSSPEITKEIDALLNLK